jgi:hypothetical protein
MKSMYKVTTSAGDTFWTEEEHNVGQRVSGQTYVYKVEVIENPKPIIGAGGQVVGYRSGKKEAIGIQPGGGLHPISAFSGTAHYLPKEYENMSKAKRFNSFLKEDKISEMESLIDFLSEMFNLNTNQVANKLLEFGIKSFDDFIEKIYTYVP